MSRTPSKHIVKILDLTSLQEGAASFLAEKGHDMKGARVTPQFSPIGIVTDVNGKHYLIDNEGCGSGIALEDESEKIYWCKDTYDEKGNLTGIGCYPVMQSTLDIVDVMSIPVKEEVRLDKFVRVFGDRLDRNSGNWDRFLSGLMDNEGNKI